MSNSAESRCCSSKCTVISPRGSSAFIEEQSAWAAGISAARLDLVQPDPPRRRRRRRPCRGSARYPASGSAVALIAWSRTALDARSAHCRRCNSAVPEGGVGLAGAAGRTPDRVGMGDCDRGGFAAAGTVPRLSTMLSWSSAARVSDWGFRRSHAETRGSRAADPPANAGRCRAPWRTKTSHSRYSFSQTRMRPSSSPRVFSVHSPRTSPAWPSCVPLFAAP